jgi:hypothetical protein
MSLLSKILDKLGLAVLLAAPVCLGLSFWFLDDFLRVMFLQGFFPVLKTSVALLCLARVADLSALAFPPAAESPRYAAEPTMAATQLYFKGKLESVAEDALAHAA